MIHFLQSFGLFALTETQADGDERQKTRHRMVHLSPFNIYLHFPDSMTKHNWSLKVRMTREKKKIWQNPSVRNFVWIHKVESVLQHCKTSNMVKTINFRHSSIANIRIISINKQTKNIPINLEFSLNILCKCLNEKLFQFWYLAKLFYFDKMHVDNWKKLSQMSNNYLIKFNKLNSISLQSNWLQWVWSHVRRCIWNKFVAPRVCHRWYGFNFSNTSSKRNAGEKENFSNRTYIVWFALNVENSWSEDF